MKFQIKNKQTGPSSKQPPPPKKNQTNKQKQKFSQALDPVSANFATFKYL